MWLTRDRFTLLLSAYCLIACASAQGDIPDTTDQWNELNRRNLAAEQQLAWQQPQAVKKMSDDAGEKFWPHFWEFSSEALLNTTTTTAVQPLALHLEAVSRWSGSRAGALFRRDGTCPSGNSPCTSINQPNSCCPNGNQCITVQDTGNGPVGCCPAGQTCGNTISGCNTAQGYSSCPNSDNKGCCIPGYACSGNICVNVGTQTVTASTSTTTTTSSSSSSSTSSAVSVITIVSINNSGTTLTATVTATVTISPSSTSTSASAAAPVRPTSSDSAASIAPASASVATSTSTSTITTTASASSAGGYCPTGYYMCSAVYLGGCCQVDRDCNTTSCPTTASTTVISGNPTVIAPTGASSAPHCAAGWYSCPASLGGNCCPTGFNCGQTNCPASVDGVAAQNKQSPSDATIATIAWSCLVISLTAGIAIIAL